MDGLLSYPLYYTLSNVFAFRDCPDCPMSRLGERFWEYKTAFADVDALGTFLDNHVSHSRGLGWPEGYSCFLAHSFLFESFLLFAIKPISSERPFCLLP